MKNYFSKIKLSQKARKLFLLNLTALVFSLVVLLTTISYFGLGRGEVGVFLINFSEKDILVTLGQEEQRVEMFDVLSRELTISNALTLATENINLALEGAATPKIYGVIVGNDAIAPFCLAKTLLNNNRSAISGEFDILASTPSKTHQFSFSLPLQQIWWPNKEDAGQNLNSEYVFVFPFTCSQNSQIDLELQAKYWLEYSKEKQLEFYNQRVLEIQNNNSYNDPGPI